MIAWRDSLAAAAAAALVLLLVMTASGPAEVESAAALDQRFTAYWAVEVAGGLGAARDVARRHGFALVGEILPGIYSFKHRRLARRSISAGPAGHHQRRLKSDRSVLWAEQQIVRKRVKRWTNTVMSDEKWMKMWYLNDEPMVQSDGVKAPSMNIRRVWEDGVFGEGVVVCVLDDGIEKNHPDLRANYDPQASFDANSNDGDPSVRPTKNDENKHGTRCAGQIAAYGNNSLCIPGIAYRAKIGAIRMLDGEVTDTVETMSLSYSPQYIQVYSSSWGPEDDGKTVEGPGYLTQKAFKMGVELGRGGLGSIYVWASGNGGLKGDNCNTDGYTNSIYTLSVNSVSEFGQVPWYSEPCSSTLAATYSSGDEKKERAIITTDLHGRCTEGHTGTSASAPIAAGIAALVLSVNRRLTWRDMQHLVVRAANPSPYLKTKWRVNGVGRRVSHDFGFGLMDALEMVRLARSWTRVPEQHSCEILPPGGGGGIGGIGGRDFPASVSENFDHVFRLRTDGCAGTRNHVRYLEHVQAKVSLTSSSRGKVQIWLHSPLGTVSHLLTRRKFDQQGNTGFHMWPFMTVHNWGETSNGTWKLVIRCEDCVATLQRWSLLLHGTGDLPAHQVMPIVPKPRRSSSSAAMYGSSSHSDAATSRDRTGYYHQQQQHNQFSGGDRQEIYGYSPELLLGSAAGGLGGNAGSSLSKQHQSLAVLWLWLLICALTACHLEVC